MCINVSDNNFVKIPHHPKSIRQDSLICFCNSSGLKLSRFTANSFDWPSVSSEHDHCLEGTFSFLSALGAIAFTWVLNQKPFGIKMHKAGLKTSQMVKIAAWNQSKQNMGKMLQLREKYVFPYGKIRTFYAKIRPFYGYGFDTGFNTYFIRGKYVFSRTHQKH